MAEKLPDGVAKLSVLDKSWLVKSLEDKRAQIVRSRAKELRGSEVWVLRGKEMEALSALMLQVQSW